MKTIACIPVRYKSNRLPGKHFLPVGGQPILGYLLDRLFAFKDENNDELFDAVVLCIGKDGYEEAYIDMAKSASIDWVVGPVDQPIERYAKAIKKFKAKTMVRITGDDCFPDFKKGAELILDNNKMGSDFTCFINYIPGMDLEAYSADAILNLAKKADAIDSERLKDLFSKNSGFKTYFHNAGMTNNTINLSLDSYEDYQEILKRLSVFDDSSAYYHFNMEDIASKSSSSF